MAPTLASLTTESPLRQKATRQHRHIRCNAQTIEQPNRIIEHGLASERSAAPTTLISPAPSSHWPRSWIASFPLDTDRPTRQDHCTRPALKLRSGQYLSSGQPSAVHGFAFFMCHRGVPTPLVLPGKDGSIVKSTSLLWSGARLGVFLGAVGHSGQQGITVADLWPLAALYAR